MFYPTCRLIPNFYVIPSAKTGTLSSPISSCFDPPFTPRFVRYKPTSLEKNYRWDLLTEHDVGVEIDLINPDAYASTGRHDAPLYS